MESEDGAYEKSEWRKSGCLLEELGECVAAVRVALGGCGRENDDERSTRGACFDVTVLWPVAFPETRARRTCRCEEHPRGANEIVWFLLTVLVVGRLVGAVIGLRSVGTVLRAYARNGAVATVLQGQTVRMDLTKLEASSAVKKVT